MRFPRLPQPLVIGLFVLGALLPAISAVQRAGSLTAQVFNGGGLSGGLTEARSRLGGAGIRMDNNLVIVIVRVLNAVLPYTAVAAVTTFIVAGFMFILGFGSESTIQQAKKIMIWSIVGIAVILFSYLITAFVVSVILA